MVDGDKQLVKRQRQLHDATSSFVVESLQERTHQVAHKQQLGLGFDHWFYLQLKEDEKRGPRKKWKGGREEEVKE